MKNLRSPGLRASSFPADAGHCELVLLL